MPSAEPFAVTLVERADITNESQKARGVGYRDDGDYALTISKCTRTCSKHYEVAAKHKRTGAVIACDVATCLASARSRAQSLVNVLHGSMFPPRWRDIARRDSA